MNEEISNAFQRLATIAVTLSRYVEGQKALPSAATSMPNAAFTDLDRLAGQLDGFLRAPVRSDEGQHGDGCELLIVETMISVRSLRDRYFENDLFFDPAWSILIDLFRAELKGERVSVTSACIGSGVADTTALRYIRALEDRGYVHRTPDPDDKRRVFLRLTGHAIDKLNAYFGIVHKQIRAA
ncbi:MAG: MarR family transcriptional regulator [Tabrizicola sp.]